MLKFFGVTPNSRVAQISRGQRAGVSLAMTLATDPELLVLDAGIEIFDRGRNTPAVTTQPASV